MQCPSFPRTTLSLLAVIVMVGSLAMLSCPGGNGNNGGTATPATVTELKHQAFVFDEGAAFGLPNQTVTLEVGDSSDGGTTAAFVLSFGDETATGTITGKPCMLSIATNTIPEIDAGVTLVLDTCEINTDTEVLTVANVAMGASTIASSRSQSQTCQPCQQPCTGSSGGTP